MKNVAKKMFSDPDLQAIAAAVKEAESKTDGEIRVDIRQRRKWRERNMTLEAIARREFHHLGMTRTARRTGILIFLLLEDRAFYLLADEGIHARVDDGIWQRIAAEMSSHFTERNFLRGIVHGVREVGSVLQKHFPRTGPERNELSDDVKIS